MLYVILIGKESFCLESIESIRHCGCTKTYYADESRFCVQFGDEYIFYDQANEITSDYEYDIYKIIPRAYTSFVMMKYSRFSIVKRIMCQDDFIDDIYVDDDYNHIFLIDDFIELLKEDKIDYLGR